MNSLRDTRAMKRPFVIGLAGFLVLVLALYAQMYSGLKRQENEIAGLESELAKAREELKTVRESHKNLTKSLESQSELSLSAAQGTSAAQALIPLRRRGCRSSRGESGALCSLARPEQFVEEVEECR